MLSLSPTNPDIIQRFFVEFQKKAKSYELPPEGAEYFGIYLDGLFIGYFILVGYSDGDLEINQGYLKPIMRHKQLSYESMKLLQTLAKEKGFKRIILKASRTLKAYTRFMSNLGFRPESIIYEKRI